MPEPNGTSLETIREEEEEEDEEPEPKRGRHSYELEESQPESEYASGAATPALGELTENNDLRHCC